MTWKSTVLVSGAGLVATWLAGVPSPTPAPQRAAPQAQAAGASRTRAPSEIEHLADRLESRNRAGDGYSRPARNPFRFAPAPVPRRTEDSETPPVPEVTSVPAPVIRLSGVAMDQVDGREEWTAILSTPTGVVLAREGDEIAPGLTVSAIGAESVTLTRPDGSTQVVPLSGN